MNIRQDSTAKPSPSPSRRYPATFCCANAITVGSDIMRMKRSTLYGIVTVNLHVRR